MLDIQGIPKDGLKEISSIALHYPSSHPLVARIEKQLNQSFAALPVNEVVALKGEHLPITRVLLVGEDRLKDSSNRRKAAQTIASQKEPMTVLIDTFLDQKEAFCEALGLVHYRFDVVQGKQFKPLTPIRVYSESPEALQATLHLIQAINLTKDLVNTPNNHLNALDLADKALAFKKYPHTDVTVLDQPAIEKLKMGAFLAVNKGSKIPPRLIHFKYRNGGNKPLISIVGKGVMYDTGGYSLKPSTSMPTMKMDMGGAANVFGILKAVALQELPINVDGIICATDNRIGDDAIVPDDIIRAADGTTIEIVSTDAEGRLTLADALWYAQQQGADKIIDMATLTGAVIGALGKEHVGAFTNQEAFLHDFLKAAAEAEEKVWWLPQDESHIQGLKSHVADMKNSGPRVAGASVAAAFLNHFVDEKTPWIHLDVAGVTYEEKAGATGRVVKAVVHYLTKQA